jgi:hypothetical protein
MTRSSGFADMDILMIHIANLADGRHTANMNTALFARGQTQEGIIAFLRHELRPYARATRKLASTPWLQLDIMDGRAGWNILQWQRVARSNLGIRT